MDSFFAVTAPGLEPFTAQELRGLDLEPATVSGGVLFKGDLTALYRANLHLRTASRILARLGNFFYATTFPELQERLARLPWERFLTARQPVSIHVTCHKSKLNHSDAVARSVSAALEERLGGASPILKAGEEGDQPPQLVVVRLAEDKCTVSVDSSGTLLHKRGYRQAVAKAPLRETLAAALLMASGWDLASPLLDPFCGSGTIPIEAALMAIGIPPGINRRFAFMDWPGYDKTLWQTIHAPSSTVHGQSPVILASDRDAGAIKMAQANAERAGISDTIEFKCQAISSITPPAGQGWVVTNPPYGLRLSQGKDLRNLYAQFGNVLREKCPGWNLAVLCSDPALLGQMQVKLDTSLALVNGGIRVRLGRGVVR
ncbi:MAG: class I SAM-dependent RNA methyltransferase [Chloroflexi bacterium]|nr:class I SAM-dependent RNA methyltransferase [Chloroflexota bacterium]